MANLTQTAANVGHSGSGVQTRTVQAGESITQGMPVYLKSSDSKYWKADANASSDTAAAVGIALTPADADGYFTMATSGPVDLGATLTVGETYVVSATAGAIAPIGDLTTGDYPTHLGVATAADKLVLNIYASGVAKP